MLNSDDVLRFWFEEVSPEQWWTRSDELDRKVRERFADLHRQACASELFSWRKTAAGRLAEVIVLDQFSRNLYRDDGKAFAQDALALALAQEAVAGGHDQQLPTERRVFFYLPYMHSESLVIHEIACQLFAQPGLENNLAFEKKHKAILDRFGRYPHRNASLGRISTAEELEFLKQPGSSF